MKWEEEETDGGREVKGEGGRGERGREGGRGER